MRAEEFDSKYCSRLNPQQLEAVHSVDGPVLLLAVPGSGKTTVLVNRLGYMVHCRGIDPRSILTMTYTKAATEEMRERFAALFGRGYAETMTFSTINSLSNQIVKLYAERHSRNGAFVLADNRSLVGIITDIYRDLNDNEYPNESTLKDIQTGIAYAKNMMLKAEDIQSVDVGVDGFEDIYARYNAELKRQRLMDFDDQMVYARQALLSYPDVLEHYQNRYRYLCVDESQDTSKIQHEIIKLLAGKLQNIFMVGDEDQSIYGFRGAYPDALLRFEEDYPNAKVLLMEQNYRSVPPIAAAADDFISRNGSRHPKTIRAVREGGMQVQTVYVSDRAMQYTYLFELGKDCSDETAVLYRNNDSALPLIDLFERSGVPYATKQREELFFTHKVVTDIKHIIRFAYDPMDGEAFRQIYYKFGGSVGGRAAEEACDRSRRSGKPILDELLCCGELNQYGGEIVRNLQRLLPTLPSMTAVEALDTIWSGMGYSKHVLEKKLDAGKIDILKLLARRENSPADLLRRLDELQAITANHKNPPDCPLILSTVHSSKGLEYERVYLLDMFDGLLPSKTREQARSTEDARQYEEDRRMYYVAMTRAKNELYVFSSPAMTSEFTEELVSRLPRAVVDENDVFAPLQTNFLGKTYTDAKRGRGVIRAHCGDRVLVVFENRYPVRMTVEEMLRERDRSVSYEAPQPRRPVPVVRSGAAPALRVGTRVSHAKFGTGVVQRVDAAQIVVRFNPPHGMKTLALETVVKNKLLVPV